MKTSMKTLAKHIFTGSVMLLPQLAHAENIDLLVLVEPSVIQSMGKEGFSKLVESQIDYSNKEFKGFNIAYNVSAVVSWDDSVSSAVASGASYSKAGSYIFYSAGYSKEKYDEIYVNDPWLAGKYSSSINGLLEKYHADKIVLFVNNKSDDDVIGRAFNNVGLIVHAQSMTSNHSTVAHELGHTFGLGHPSSESCNASSYLMCQGAPNSSGFLVEESERINGVLNKDPEFLLDYYHQDFWGGSYSYPMDMLASAKVSVVDNPVPNTLNKTEVVVELIDAAGAPYVFNKDVSLELYTKANSAVAGINYDADVFQQINFAAGENVKRVDLSVTHGSKDLSFVVGTRYGENTSDSNQETVVIKASSGGDTGNGGNEGSGSGGGSLGIWGLILTPLAFLRRRLI